MIKLAVLETEEVAKTIIFELGRLLQNHDITFQYFTKISEFAKVEAVHKFDIVVFHEKFNTERITKSFVLTRAQQIVVYVMHKEKKGKVDTANGRILFLHSTHIHEDLKRMIPQIQNLLKHQDEYLFSYNNITVPLKINEIYYIEKEDKLLIYHTKRGEFRERKNMKDAQNYFDKYQFLRIHTSYLINFQYVTKFDNDFVFLQKMMLPIARSRRQEIREKVRSFTKN